MANGYFERGEIYWVRMDTGLGTEQGVGRPGIILSNNELNNQQTVVVVAFLSRKYFPAQRYVEVFATGQQSYVICNQFQSVDKGRLGKLIGKLNAAEQKAVDDALENVLDLGYVDDTELKAKDAEIEARNAVIAEKDAEIQSLKDRMTNLEAAHGDEVAALNIEIDVLKRLYAKALDLAADEKFREDLFRRQAVEEEPPVVEEPPADDRVDINSATLTALKKVGFTLPMAQKIKEGRPYSSVDDLKRVPGLKANMLKIVEPKLCCRPVVGTEAVTKGFDPGFEPVDINTATPKELREAGCSEATSYRITSYRKKNGPFHSIEELRTVPISEEMLNELRDRLICVVAEDDTGKLNVNQATVTELVEVGFTDVIADRIVAYRDKNGSFGAVYDLLKVEGVTGKTLRGVADKVGV